MSMKELTAVAMRVLTEQSLGQMARLADYTINQVRDFARATMVVHLTIQILAGVFAISGVLAFSIGWGLFVSENLVGFESLFYINAGLFLLSLFSIILTLRKYSRRRHNFAIQTNKLTHNLSETLLNGFMAYQKEHNIQKQDDRLEKLEKSIELIAQALSEDFDYGGPRPVPNTKNKNQTSEVNNA